MGVHCTVAKQNPAGAEKRGFALWRKDSVASVPDRNIGRDRFRDRSRPIFRF